MAEAKPRRRDSRAWLWAAVASLLLHLPIAAWFLHVTWLAERPVGAPPPLQVELLDLSEDGSALLQSAQPDPVAAADEPDAVGADREPTPPEPEGQIVEIAPPDEPKRPETAKYLAEYDSDVVEETVDPRYRVDRQVTAPTYSPDDAFELQDRQELGIEKPSSGGTSGAERFRRGPFSLFPDRDFGSGGDDRPGLASSVPARHEQDRFAGSPSNDWLPEVRRGDRTALDAHEFLYASFWNRVKQLVSFYADQTLANAYPSVPVTRLKYEMELGGLIGLDGQLVAIETVQPSGVPEFDEAIREAFRLAAPFPDPPAPAAESDGYIHLRNFEFVITIGTARAELTGIDPRQNVQFPGLQTVPR
jgi:hypothetical protein